MCLMIFVIDLRHSGASIMCNTCIFFTSTQKQIKQVHFLPDRLSLPVASPGPRGHFLPGPGAAQEADQGPPGHHGEGQEEPREAGEAAAAAAGAGGAAEGGAVRRGKRPR